VRAHPRVESSLLEMDLEDVLERGSCSLEICPNQEVVHQENKIERFQLVTPWTNEHHLY